MRRFIVFIVCFFSLYSSNGQKQDYVWCFGDCAGLDFNSGVPVPFQSSIYSVEASASISDKNGNLLFYGGTSDYGGLLGRAFNRNHQLMQNSDSLLFNGSCTNGMVIVPFSSDSIKYYLFHISYPIAKLYYSIINMTLDGGMGAIIQKNNILLPNDTLTERIAAVRHGNGRDWWIIVHPYNSSDFISFLVSSTGINGPYVQTIGSFLGYYSIPGEISFSNSGNKLALATIGGIIDLYDFERCTGILSNWQSIGPPIPVIPEDTYYGCSFSSNEQLLYITSVYPPTSSLFQYDLTAPNIPNSRQTIFSTQNDSVQLGQLQLAPDGKIYLPAWYGTSFPNTFFNSYNMNLSVINTPDSIGTGCNFSAYSVYLGGRRCLGGLPNEPNYNLGAQVGSSCDTLTSLVELKNNSDKYIGKLFPNPNNGTMNYQFSSATEITGKFVIYDLTGREIISYPVERKNTQILYNDQQKLSPGVYEYKLLTDSHEEKDKGKLIIIK